MVPSGESIRVVHPLFPVEGGGSIPTSPLQLTFGQIDWKTATDINRLFHSRLPEITNAKCGHALYFGAEFNGMWYASAIWTDPIARLFNGKGYLELRRMAISDDAPKNTASRMLSWMRKSIERKFPEIVKLISYQDMDIHSGIIYSASGWRKAAINKDGSWDRPNRSRIEGPAMGAKQRWEYDLRKT